MKKAIASEILASAKLLGTLADDADLVATVERAARKAIAVYKAGGKLIFAGNGGSAADAQHFVGEMVNRFRFDRPALAAIALSTDTSVLTAIGNDAGYDQIFSRQLEANGRRGDMFVAISTSGRAVNIIRALGTCKDIGIYSLGLTGRSGGDMAPLCDLCIRVPSDQTPRIQEAHALLGHIFCGLVEAGMFGKAEPPDDRTV